MPRPATNRIIPFIGTAPDFGPTAPSRQSVSRSREIPRALAGASAAAYRRPERCNEAVCGAAVQVAARSGLGRTAGVEQKAAARSERNRHQRPPQVAKNRHWRNRRGRDGQGQRACQADIVADCAEILGKTAWRLFRRGGMSAGRTVGRIGRNRQRGGDGAEITQVKVTKRERELASQRKERQPGKLAAVRSEPSHGAWHLASPEVEAYRNNKGQFGIGNLIWRSRHRL